MATHIVLKNVLVKSSSSRAGKPKGSQFVLGKGIKIALPSTEAEKLLDLQNRAKAKVSTQFNVPEKRVKVTELVKYNPEDNSDFMFLNFTKVPQEKGTEKYLQNEDGTYVEEICNFLPNEETGKMERKMPTIIFQGAETEFLPFADSIIDVDLLIRTSYDQEKLAIKLYVSVETVTVVKPAEGQTGGSTKQRNIVDIDLDDEETDAPKSEKKTAKKTTKKAETEEVVEVEEVKAENISDIF